MRKWLIPAAFAIAALALVIMSRNSVQAAGPVPVPEAACISCHDQRNLNLNFSSGEAVSVYVSPTMVAGSVHGTFNCTSCHQSSTSFPHEPGAATFADFRVAQDQICRNCHTSEAAQIQSSVHSRASAGDAGLCIDCHSAHNVQDPLTASARIDSVNVCMNCHQNNGLMEKYGVSNKVVGSYFQDFHGKTDYMVNQQSGDPHLAQAVCTDCHGVHNIQQVSDASSTVVKANLAATCARCHEGATPNFTSAWLSHKEPSLSESPLVFAVRWFYRLLIPFITVGLLIHIMVDLLRRKEVEHE